MSVYVDSSVILGVILGQPGRLASWGAIETAVSSELVRVECLRTIDRAKIEFRLSDEAVARQRADVLQVIDGLTLVALDAGVLERASGPFPTQLGTLDAIHLASALLVRDRLDTMTFATHDRALGLAARAMGFRVEGA